MSTVPKQEAPRLAKPWLFRERPSELEEPIRSEIFSPERLEEHARSLAAVGRAEIGRRSRSLRRRLRENGRVLLAAYRSIAQAVRDGRAITPAAEWLVDNFHIVDEQLREIHDDLPPSFYRELPKIVEGHLEGYPRILGIAWAYVAHTDSRLDPEIFYRFLRAYQQVTPLTIGELWAVPIGLRILLVENLRRLAERVMRSREDREAADDVADALLGVAGRTAESPETVLRRYESRPLSRAFAVELAQRLREEGPNRLPGIEWLDKRLLGQGTSADELVRIEVQSQASANVTVRNIVTSMRLLSDFDWEPFVERASLVDQVLRAGTNFAALDFRTRDQYRHAIEELARGSGRTELEIAGEALRRSRESGPDEEEPMARERRWDPGYFLIAGGRLAFEKGVGFRVSWKQRILRTYVTAADPGYVVTIALFTSLLVAAPLLQVAREAGLFVVLALALLLSFPAGDLAVALVNRAVTGIIGPHALPKLELRGGAPPDSRTLVVIPTLLTNEAEVEELIGRLQIHYLANPEGELHFALLSDWLDAEVEEAPGDEELVAAAVAGIRRLNERYGAYGGRDPRFMILHRRRVWNESQRKWMGWERKRGKLHELNRLLRGATDTTFLAVGGEPPVVPGGIRYVITLDADTRLPRGAAYRLIGAISHPLNRPFFDPKSGRVIGGYGILQPRVTPTLPDAGEGSLFQRIFSGPAGIDPYSAAVSDVYQDLFQEGSYTGKGIYEVDAFEASLAGRVPENTLLSHDLFEGIFARAGFASDIEIFEEFPSHYQVAAARQHRWARGDWQLLPWVLGHARDGRGRRMRRSLPFIGGWKIVDNLRRTLSAPATFLTLAAGWMLPIADPGVWTAFVLATISIPALLPFASGLIPRRQGFSKRTHLRAVGTDLVLALSEIALAVIFLAHQAYLMSDAIARTLARLYVTRKNLLEWTTAAQTRAGLEHDTRTTYRRMASAVVLAASVAAAIFFAHPEAGSVAAPFIVAWMLSPAIARWVSQLPAASREQPLSEESRHALRSTARRTWRFFETFVGAEDNSLPPDNFQAHPKGEVAHRTSPTNLGMYLLSVVSAHDFGWLGTADLVDRIEATLGSMERLERFRGHFYNWYETRDLRPLEPKYVSSVDSGNLAGHLLALANACREVIDRPLFGAETRAGIEDALLEIRAGAAGLADDRRTGLVTRRDFDDALAALVLAIDSVPAMPAAWARWLATAEFRAEVLLDIAGPLVEGQRAALEDEVLAWASAAKACIASHRRDLLAALPGIALDADEAGPGHEVRQGIGRRLATVPTLGQIAERCEVAIAELASFRGLGSAPRGNAQYPPAGRPSAIVDGWVDGWIAELERAAATSAALVRRLSRLAERADALFQEMDFRFLFDPTRKLFAIGYRVSDGVLDPNCYDLLASEACLTSFVAIAKGDVPVSHWFRLGRSLTPFAQGSALISWSGSMFEYLMPTLVMRPPRGSLFAQTYRVVVARQIQYGRERGVPWGVSESAYNALDLDHTYQYSSFGVPGLGLKRGLIEDVVSAPYATGLATMVDAEAAMRNFTRLTVAGGSGPYGFYEALDYTPTRVPEGEAAAIVRAYMAHHQGMLLVALANVLTGGKMQARFHAEPIVRATELLLQERTPRDTAVARPRAEEVEAAAHVRDLIPPLLRRFHSPHDPTPRTHLLSNGRYVTMVTAAGSGYSRWRNLAVTRWREDVTRDAYGTFVFLRDIDSGEVWSAGYQPAGTAPSSYEVAYSEDHAEIVRRDGAITTTLEIVVSPEDDAEVRRVSIANLGTRMRTIELTSYAEVVLAPPAADAAHPAFSNLFVETEFVSESGALLATRRPRTPSEPRVWAGHVCAVDGPRVAGVQFETDRARFLGRGRTIRTPISVIDGRPLSNTVGSVLDPIVSLRHRLRIPAGTTARVSFSTLVAATRDEALGLIDKYRHPDAFERALTLAWTQAQAELHHLRLSPDEAHLFQRLANRLLYLDPTLRASGEILARNHRGQRALWPHGISGDLPIVLLRIDDPADRDIVRQLLRAKEYWRAKGVAVDLVILNEQAASYAQELEAGIEDLVRAVPSRPRPDGSPAFEGSVRVLRRDHLTIEDHLLLQAAARVVLLSRRGTLAEQVVRAPELAVPPSPSVKRISIESPRDPRPFEPDVEFFNGLGGFGDEGREYVMVLGEGQWTPKPWINVIANPSFGFQVSESGAGYTFAGNSRENQLTPWSNDAVSDPPGETFYVRDEESWELWGPTVLPIREEPRPYIARHGQGYSSFEHVSHGIALALLQLVPLDDPIKISRLVLENQSSRRRRLSVTGYVEWVLGFSRATGAPFIRTELDRATGAIFARNPWNHEFGDRVAFADLAGRQTAWTANRTEFLGRNGTLDHPVALERGAPLSGAVGAGMDPCACLQTVVELAPGERAEVRMFLGQAASEAEARALLERYRSQSVDSILTAVRTHWDDTLGTLQVKTPDRSMDLLVNRWLLYQTLACRLWARAGFYQAGGAYGFRDQLQDVMALTLSRRAIVREHLLRAAARQFVEGDVQHWWHPPSGRGVRTRISDDLVWLPYAVVHYLEVTGDSAILDATIPFLEGPPLAPGEHDAYFEPAVSSEHGTLFEHCARALDRSLAVGRHGLPLIGGGDWNDGMNRVGHEGEGESVWLGWFLHTTLWEFARLADLRRQHETADRWRRHVHALKAALEREGWDGDWYRRAYFDDGSPLGSAANAECRIDSIAQSWGVISGGADPVRAKRAMAAVEEYLVRRGDGLVLLFAPPFDHSLPDPGYIKGYLPGVRENGGQYTHGAIWTILAFAALGEGDKAGELFSILNPVNHGSSRAGIHRYKVEPYVTAGDVYAEAPHVGRGGWTWYTGSAGWMYRAAIEWIFGVRFRGSRLHIDPCIPRRWRGFEIVFRYHSARYEIRVENPRGVTRGVESAEIDGQPLARREATSDLQRAEIPLVDDGATHHVRVVLG